MGGTNTMAKLRPLGDRVVLKAVEREEMTRSGLVLPDTAKEKPQEGEVIAVGPGKLLESGDHVPLDLKAGDRVIFSKYSGTEFKLNGEDLLILSERDILAVVG
jgi:chaperonin GroES